MALLLLRLAAALMIAAACCYAGQARLDVWVPIVSSLAIVLLLLGLGTRPVALVCAAVALGIGALHRNWSTALIAVHGLNLIAIAILGAGAYSIDARLFGRRVIRINR